METVMERESSSALGGLFQTTIGDMKGSYPVWDDFISKASKLQSQLRATVVTVAAFLDAFQRVADLATNSRGGTRDIGSSLTRMCLRHRSIEAKLRQFSMVFLDCLINPLQEQMEEWKRAVNVLDKEHAKEYKKARHEIKKRSSDTLKLQKKAKKADVFGRGDLQPQLDVALQDVSDKVVMLEEMEKQALRKALVEERSRFCCFVSLLRPVVEEEMSMLGEITHLQTLTDDLRILTMDPHKLPASSEQVIVDLKSSECCWSFQTPPSSPNSSVCSSLNSVTSSDSRSSGSLSLSHSPSSHFRFRCSSSSSSSALPPQTNTRLSSVSSHDSGFISHDAFTSKPSPTATIHDRLMDWTKAGPYDHPVLRKNKERRETTDPSSHLGTADVTAGVEPPGVKGHMVTSPKVRSAERDTHEELVRVLARGLHLDIHDSSRDSLQGSSGYSSQTNTPCCSEDAIPSQLSDCDNFSVVADQDAEQQPSTTDFNKSSIVPRNSDIIQSYRRMFSSKRPASTVGATPHSSVPAATPGVATIRRTPSSKPNLRRPNLSLGPIPIRPPMIPVKTPTVPEQPGFPYGGPRTPTTPLSPGDDLKLVSSRSAPWEFQHEESDPPTPPPQPGRWGSEREIRFLPELLEEAEYGQVEDYLVAIRRGVKLKNTTTNDRSAPMIH
ncbi:metastasis suppressor protein 1-like isoform X3 [Gouania willdenowi]|uniref:metastasis suppressor protein 1-like isoform X3 n=1 Tax=Gouania willdenowi TaxID=441366 RepID=UPI0010555C28|nr:metastasis suppressor protein 1-like isoform X3 [Gouania willdenowi]